MERDLDDAGENTSAAVFRDWKAPAVLEGLTMEELETLRELRTTVSNRGQPVLYPEVAQQQLQSYRAQLVEVQQVMEQLAHSSDLGELRQHNDLAQLVSILQESIACNQYDQFSERGGDNAPTVAELRSWLQD